ncbi:MAG: hypothetical protein JRJ87_00230 [Deltaproteobacteria bacterium]|nr:hypothetical protein [Deltaproteobacteria bacterium]
MKRTIFGLLLASVLLVNATTAKAVITTDVVVVLGVELSPGAKLPDEKRLRPHDLKVYTTPSMTWNNDKRPMRHFVGKRLGSLPLHRKGSESISIPVLSASEIEQVRAALKKVGISEKPKLILVVQHSGGK